MEKDYAVGQVWHYHTRPEDEGSTVTIMKIEKAGDFEIFHVYTEGLCLLYPMSEKGIQETLPHMPLSRETLDMSVTTLKEVVTDLPGNGDFEYGYGIWKEAFDAGEAGAYTISICRIFELVQMALVFSGVASSLN